MIESLQPKAGGRPATPEREKQLQRRPGEAAAENERLRRRVETTERILGVASGLLRGRIGRESRSEGGKEPRGGRVSADRSSSRS